MWDVEIIAAVSVNNVIGDGNEIPWDIPEDMAYFKEHTVGRVVIMGRKTYESIGRPLPDRVNVVLSNTVTEIDGCVVMSSMEDAIKEYSKGPISIIGGSEIYKLGMGYASSLRITHVHQTVDGDAFFPEIGQEWVLASTDPREGYTFSVYSNRI